MKNEIGTIRVGTCKHNQEEALQQFTNCDTDDDATDEKGWLCLHMDTRKEEKKEVKEFKAGRRDWSKPWNGENQAS